MKVYKIGLTLNTKISRTALVLKLKFSGLSNFIYWKKFTKFQLNLRESPGDLIKNLLSWHGMIRNEFLKNAAWSRMINFLNLSGDDANLRNADWESQVKMLRFNFLTQMHLPVIWKNWKFLSIMVEIHISEIWEKIK